VIRSSRSENLQVKSASEPPDSSHPARLRCSSDTRLRTFFAPLPARPLPRGALCTPRRAPPHPPRTTPFWPGWSTRRSTETQNATFQPCIRRPPRAASRADGHVLSSRTVFNLSCDSLVFGRLGRAAPAAGVQQRPLGHPRRAPRHPFQQTACKRSKSMNMPVLRRRPTGGRPPAPAGHGCLAGQSTVCTLPLALVLESLGFFQAQRRLC
jgi:hypothetical protein